MKITNKHKHRKNIFSGFKYQIESKLKKLIKGKSVFSDVILPNKFDIKADKYLKLAKSLAVFGAFLVFLFYLPQAWYGFAYSFALDATSKIAGNRESNKPDLTQFVFKADYQPPFDSNLPKENLLVIPSLGIKTLINEATSENYENALRKGVWRVWDFGVPASRDYPVILAAHRYGYLNWSIPYRLKNSFYKLPKLSENERVEIIWNQRKYTYLVYKEEKGEVITDYSADLILYTCENLSSPARIIRYAKLLEV